MGINETNIYITMTKIIGNGTYIVVVHIYIVRFLYHFNSTSQLFLVCFQTFLVLLFLLLFFPPSFIDYLLKKLPVLYYYMYLMLIIQ